MKSSPSPSPIHVLEAHLGDFDLVRLLLRAGADPEQEIPGSGGGGGPGREYSESRRPWGEGAEAKLMQK